MGGLTNLVVGGTSGLGLYARARQGIESIAGELAERRGLTLDHAHGWLGHVPVLIALDELEGEQDIVIEAREVLNDGVRRIGDEVRKSVSSYP